MANLDNLIPEAHKLTVEEQSKGGKASAKSRKEKATIRKMLNDFLETEGAKNPHFAKIAKQMGLSEGKSIKELFAILCIFNSAKTANIQDLERLQRILGEDIESTDNGILDDLLEYLKND